MNVKLVASLRQKVKAKVKAVLEGNGDKSKDVNKKNMLQKVFIICDPFRFPDINTRPRLYSMN